MALVATLQMVSVCHAQAARVLQRGQGVGGFAGLRDGDDQGVRVRHAVAVAVFAGDLDVHRQLGHRFDPVLGGQAGVVAGAAGQDQHAVDFLEDAEGLVAEQFRHDAGDAFEVSPTTRGCSKISFCM
jgi:hypothetical protein